MNDLTYIFPGKLGESEGVDLKIIGQTEALSAKYDVKISSLLLYQKNSSKWLKIIAFTISPIRWLIDCLKSDIVYYRYSVYFPVFNVSLLWLSLFRTVWIEYNTVAKYELRLLHWWLPMLHEFQTFILKYSRVRHIAVTQEIKELEKLPQNTLIMPNGYYKKQNSIQCSQSDFLGNVEKHIVEEKAKGKKIFIFVGNDRPWNGVKRIIKLLKEFNNLFLILVGNIGDFEELVLLEKAQRVVRLGLIESDLLPHIYDKVDFSFGTFALDAKNMKEACPLKVREYLWFGLPVIINYIDPLLNEEWSKDFIYKVDWNCLEDVDEFISRTYIRNDIIKGARENLKWENVFIKTGVL